MYFITKKNIDMKNLILFIGSFCLFFLISCSSSTEEIETLTVEESDILGNYDLTEVRVNNVIDPNVSTSHVLSIREGNEYYRTYVTGSWDLNLNQLVFTPTDEFLNPWNCTIISVDANTIELEMQITETDYLWNLEDYDEDEVVTINEIYTRQ